MEADEPLDEDPADWTSLIDELFRQGTEAAKKMFYADEEWMEAEESLKRSCDIL
jgi:hypothetical protein